MDSVWNETNSSRGNHSPHLNAKSADHIIRAIWLSVVFAFGTVGNVLLFSVILRKGRITNVTNLFNMNLAIADLTRIFLFIPVYLVYSAYDSWPAELSLGGCKGVFLVLQNSLTVSILTLLFMSIERFRAVVHPLKKQMSIRVARCLVVASWFLGFIGSVWYSMAMNLVTNSDGHAHCQPGSKGTVVNSGLLLMIIGTQWLPGAAFTVTYIMIILKLRRDAVITPSDISQSSQNRHRRNMRAARILVIEVLFFLGCLYPFYHYSIDMVIGASGSAGALTQEGTVTFCMMITYSLTNPFCHILLNSEFRGEVRRMCQQIKRFCGLENKQITNWPEIHLPGWHVHRKETRQSEERNDTNGSKKIKITV